MSRTIEDLRMKQALPLDVKISLTRERIRQWVNEFGEDGVYVSFSGGKDSTVLLDIVRNVCGYKDIPAVFVDVPTQFPELRDFAKTFDNIEILKPKISFMEVCEKYGFPLISKDVSLFVWQIQQPISEKNAKTHNLRLNGIRSDGTKVIVGKLPEKYKPLANAPFRLHYACCNVMKKDPLHKYTKQTDRKPITAQMADESMVRSRKWLQNGCNAFDVKHPISNPMSFWTENDVLTYIVKNKLKICSVYGDVIEDYGDQVEGQMDFGDFGLYPSQKKYKCTGCRRTGCMLCGFGCHLESSPNRFETLKITHPGMYKLLDVVKNNGVTMREAIEWINEHCGLNIIT